MKSRLTLLVVILAVLVVCYGTVARVAPAPRLSRAWSPWARSSGEGGGTESGAKRDMSDYEDVTVKIEIPPLSEFPDAWAKGGGCPHITISRTLGAAVGPAGGVPVLGVEPGKPAAEAGIMAGDLLGGPDDCVSSLYRAFLPRKEARTVEWTVHRPKPGVVSLTGMPQPGTQ